MGEGEHRWGVESKYFAVLEVAFDKGGKPRDDNIGAGARTKSRSKNKTKAKTRAKQKQGQSNPEVLR
jgi:hypothetical protein